MLDAPRRERPEEDSAAGLQVEGGAPLASPDPSGSVPPPLLGDASRQERLLGLQQTHGNAYVQQLVAAQSAEQAQTPEPSPTASGQQGDQSGAEVAAAQTAAGPPPVDAQVEVSQQPPQVEAPTSDDVHDQPPARMLEQAGASALQSLDSAAQAAPTGASSAPAAPPTSASVAAPQTAGPVDLGLAPAVASAPVAAQAAAQLDAVRNDASQLGSARVAFGPATAAEQPDGAAAPADSAAANDMLANFMATVAERAQQIADVSTGVPDTILAAADAAAQSISAHVDEQAQAISGHLDALRAQASADADSAREAVLQQFAATSEAVTSATSSARQLLESEYNAALQSVETRETAQLQVIDDRYRAGDQRFRDAGRVVGGEAVQRGKQMAEQYMAGLVDEDDSFLDGPLTYKRGEARAETATQMGEGYQKGLQDEANKQADQALQGKAHDAETAHTTARHAREAMASQYTAILKTVADAETSSLQLAEHARASLCDGIDQALLGAGQALDQQHAALLQGVGEAAQAQSASIAQQADQLVAAIHDQLAQAAAGVVDSGQAVTAQLQGLAAPQPDVLGAALSDATAQLDAGLSQVQSDVATAVANGQQQLGQAADQAGDGLASSSQTGLDGATQAAGEITTALQSLGASAGETFSNVQQSHDSVLATTSTAASGGFGQAVDGVQQAYDAMSAGLERGFAENGAALEQGLRGALPKMEEEIRTKAEENASHVPPRWKSVVKWILIVAVMVVVALVVGPFVIGAVGAMLGTGAVVTGIIAGAIVGGITSATIQVINNWAENKPLGEGVLKAAVIGAIGGAVGGGFGAWVGQLGDKGVAIANTAFRQFALNTGANIVVENTINAFTGNLSWASFGMSIVSAVAVGGAMHAASGFESVSGLQKSSMASGEGAGGSVLSGLGGTVEINYRPTQAAPTVTPEEPAAPAGPTSATQPAETAPTPGSPKQIVSPEELPGGPKSAANDNGDIPPNGPAGPNGASQPVPVEEPHELPRGTVANDNNEPPQEALAATGTDDARPPAPPDQRKFEVIDGGGQDDAPRAMAGDQQNATGAPRGPSSETEIQPGNQTKAQAPESVPSEETGSPAHSNTEDEGVTMRPAVEDPAARPTLSKVRALRDAGIPQDQRRAMFENSKGVYDIDAVKPLPDGDNIGLTPFRAGAVKPQGQEVQFGFAPFEDFDQIHLQAKQLNARLLNEPRFADLAEAIPELEAASGIIFFAKPGMMSGNPLTAAEMQYVLSTPAILAKTTFVTGFFP